MLKVASVLAGLAGVSAWNRIEETSRFELVEPKELAAQWEKGIVEGTPALFGGFAFGDTTNLNGQIYYAQPSDDKLGCQPFSKEDIAKWPLTNRKGGLIVLVDRGNCTFVTKVRHVQEGGAVAAIIVDDQFEPGLPYMADDNTGANINIPSMLIHAEDGAAILAHMKQNPNDPVVARLSWNLPHPDGRVEWEMWTSSDNLLADKFKVSFAPVAEALGESAYLIPHYEFYNPNWNCEEYDGFNPCEYICTNKGRYCTFDPDSDLDVGLNGSHIVRENVRQICYYRYVNGTKQHKKWWDYVVKFEQECHSEELWGEACSWQVMKDVGTPDAPAAVQKCIADSGGYGINDDTVNTIIEDEINRAYDRNIFNFPSFFINERPYRGGYECDTEAIRNAQTPEQQKTALFDRSRCSMLGALCTGFKEGTQPDACKSPSWCPIATIPDKCKVCAGACNGDCGKDECGDCMERTSENWNKKCKDCQGTPYGTAQNDVCGNCAGVGKDACGLCPTKDHAWVNDTANCPKERIEVEHINHETGLPDWAIATIIIVSVLVVAGGAFVYQRRKEHEMRQDIDDLLRQYIPMGQDGETQM